MPLPSDAGLASYPGFRPFFLLPAAVVFMVVFTSPETTGPGCLFTPI